jgi:uroporphyrin-III C-methyltransferase
VGISAETHVFVLRPRYPATQPVGGPGRSKRQPATLHVTLEWHLFLRIVSDPNGQTTFMPTKPNTVYLVGAGPGHPDLLTLKAHRILREADEILHDDLVPAPILALANPSAVVANVGKRCGAKTLTQEEINARMIRSAREGRTVARLKGGDPGIFGRLAEEIDALEAAGVPFEVVPGITAGMAAAASLGISLTDRRKSSHAIFVSAHPARQGDKEARPDWKSLAHHDGVLVIYMPGSNLARLRNELVAAGLDAQTPAALVSHVSTPEQTVRYITLDELSRTAPVEAPAVLLLGRSLDAAHRRHRAPKLTALLDEAMETFSRR